MNHIEYIVLHRIGLPPIVYIIQTVLSREGIKRGLKELAVKLAEGRDLNELPSCQECLDAAEQMPGVIEVKAVDPISYHEWRDQ